MSGDKGNLCSNVNKRSVSQATVGKGTSSRNLAEEIDFQEAAVVLRGMFVFLKPSLGLRVEASSH